MKWPHMASAAQGTLGGGPDQRGRLDRLGRGATLKTQPSPGRGLIDTALREAGWVAPSYRPGLGFADVFGFAPAPRSSSC